MTAHPVCPTDAPRSSRSRERLSRRSGTPNTPAICPRANRPTAAGSDTPISHPPRRPGIVSLPPATLDTTMQPRHRAGTPGAHHDVDGVSPTTTTLPGTERTPRQPPCPQRPPLRKPLTRFWLTLYGKVARVYRDSLGGFRNECVYKGHRSFIYPFLSGEKEAATWVGETTPSCITSASAESSRARPRGVSNLAGHSGWCA